MNRRRVLEEDGVPILLLNTIAQSTYSGLNLCHFINKSFELDAISQEYETLCVILSHVLSPAQQAAD